jgi:hemerythrin-like domain-containing protein
MIECKDKNIFTSKKNLSVLIEFVNHFNLKIHHVKTEDAHISSLEKIPEIFCNQNHKFNNDFILIQKDVLNKHQTRKKILQNASAIKEKIHKHILKKNNVTFSELQKMFEKHNLSVSTLNNLFRQVRAELTESGINVCKIKNGSYTISKNK